MTFTIYCQTHTYIPSLSMITIRVRLGATISTKGSFELRNNVTDSLLSSTESSIAPTGMQTLLLIDCGDEKNISPVLDCT